MNYKKLPWREKTKYKRKLAKYLGITVTTVNGYITNGVFPEKHQQKLNRFNEKYKV